MAYHRDGGCDPTELALTVQPANTAQPVETTTTILPQAGVPIAVVLDPELEDRWTVFSRSVGDQVLTLYREGDRIIDRETGTVWDVVTGRALEGPLQGEILGILPSFTAFESDARTFWPNARYWGE